MARVNSRTSGFAIVFLEGIDGDFRLSSVKNRSASSPSQNHSKNYNTPRFDVSQLLHQNVEVDSVGRVKVKLVSKGLFSLFWRKRFIEGILLSFGHM
jgi:hypothetical protein